MTLRKIAALAADLLLPDTCSICGRSLSLQRTGDGWNIPLCRECRDKADNSIFSRAYPAISRCTNCGFPLSSEESICSRCREREWSFDSATSLFLYLDTGKQLIRAYKFDNRKALSHYFAEKAAELQLYRRQGFTIVPVPFRPSAKRKRGWDQVEAICRILNKKYGYKTSYCLKRINGRAQKTMNYEDRLTNLENGISLRYGTAVPDKVLLLDDVFTTGATMNRCSCVLKEAGCSTVVCLAMAIDL
ncbi:MAG: ComF family protein [Spirochaetales bacterium]|uniref:ComF family protein n=1 Tax=Candidatus Thalassospirochaeta sargassi TaxID=3119039 RepID=A0AAJ1IED3_9SPIO|nr:ComF family protein [Spirochaetales bacterium]